MPILADINRANVSRDIPIVNHQLSQSSPSKILKLVLLYK